MWRAADCIDAATDADEPAAAAAATAVDPSVLMKFLRAFSRLVTVASLLLLTRELHLTGNGVRGIRADPEVGIARYIAGAAEARSVGDAIDRLLKPQTRRRSEVDVLEERQIETLRPRASPRDTDQARCLDRTITER